MPEETKGPIHDELRT